MGFKMVKHSLDKIEEEMAGMEDSYCYICERNLPNKDFKTREGCIWCDSKYHIERIK